MGLQQEILEQEREAMLRQLERLKEEDLLKAEMKKEAAKKLMEEVAASNSQMIRMKELKRQKEIEEDQRIAAYLEEKAAREQAHQDELDRIAAEKEAEVIKLRQMQEKASDKKSELDPFVQSEQWNNTRESGGRKNGQRLRSKR